MSYYYSLKTSKKESGWKEIPQAETADQAVEMLKSHLIMIKSKSNTSDFVIISDEEYFDLKLKEKKAKEEELKNKRESLKLDPVAIRVYEYVLDNDYNKLLKTKDDKLDDEIRYLKEHGLKENTDKPYYVHCYWETDSNGQFGDLKDVEKIYAEKATFPGDESYDIALYDAKTCKILYPKITVNVKIELE